MPSPEFSPSEFFARQDAAKARTGRLVLLFALAMAGTTSAVYFAALFAMGAAGFREDRGMDHTTLFLLCLGGTALVAGGAALYKSAALSGGGGAVAETVGGRPVNLSTNDPAERRFINVVQEMSLASGVPMPALYVLDREEGINAFAAGDSPENAAIAATRGALEKLSRDELQAVMGHEFSHILNGDMRLNIRLIGWIFGLMAMTVVGRVIFQISPDTRSRRSRDDKGEGNAGAAFMIFGLLLVIIGFIGNLFAQMIQAAISRQREHLADASATQFTRNPEALANALRRIAGDAAGTKLKNPHAAEVAHMCFGDGVSSLFATHPPLDERIRLLKPDWDGTPLPPLSNPARGSRNTEREKAAYPEPGYQGDGSGYTPPTEFRSLVSTPDGAKAAMILLMMADNPAADRENAAMLKARVSPALFETLKHAWGAGRDIPPGRRLAAARLAAPALAALSPQDAGSLLANLAAIAQTDGAITGYEKDLHDFVASATSGRTSAS